MGDSSTIQSLSNVANNVMDAIGNVGNASVSRYIGKTQIVSRVYISGSLEHNQHLPAILNFTHNMYMAAMLNALNLTRFVDGAKTVSDLIRPLATETAIWVAGDGALGIENAIGFEGLTEEVAAAKDIINGVSTTDSQHPGSAAAGVKMRDASIGGKGKDGDISANTILPQGKVLSVVFAPVGKDGNVTATGEMNITKENEKKEGDDKKDDRRFTVDLTVRLSPFTVPNNLMDAFMAFNYTPTLSQRWMQYRTGEISFWRDFMFAQDIVNQRSKIFRLDKTGTLSSYLEMMQIKKAGIISRVVRALINTKMGGEKTLNVANTVLIFSKQDVERYRSMTGHDLYNNEQQRNLFLHNCMAMFMIIIDPVLNKVLFAINTYGLILAEGTYGVYNITDFELPKKGQSDMALVTDMIKSLMAGRMPTL